MAGILIPKPMKVNYALYNKLNNGPMVRPDAVGYTFELKWFDTLLTLLKMINSQKDLSLSYSAVYRRSLAKEHCVRSSVQTLFIDQ